MYFRAEIADSFPGLVLSSFPAYCTGTGNGPFRLCARALIAFRASVFVRRDRVPVAISDRSSLRLRLFLGFGRAIHLDEHDGIGHMGIGVCWIELNSFLQLEGRLFPLPFTRQQAPQVGPGSGVVRIDGQGCAEGSFRAALVSDLRQIRPEIVLRVREVRLEVERLSEGPRSPSRVPRFATQSTPARTRAAHCPARARWPFATQRALRRPARRSQGRRRAAAAHAKTSDPMRALAGRRRLHP